MGKGQGTIGGKRVERRKGCMVGHTHTHTHTHTMHITIT